MEISEIEAREILQTRKIERDLGDSRSCVQIATAFGLLAIDRHVQIHEVIQQEIHPESLEGDL